jgi:diguanylate cyclase (GGDEF)-like protein/PAS domain S-box-containing protein
MFKIYNSPLDRMYVFGSQVCFLLCSLFLILGVCLFLNKKIPEGVYIVLTINLIWVAIAMSQNLSFYAITIPVTTTLGIAHMWTGILFLKSRKLEGSMENFVGSVFILWGLHQIDYPFINMFHGFVPGAFFISTILGIFSIICMLLLYFQCSRQELRTNEKKYKMLIDNVNDIIYRYQFLPEAGFEYVSPASEKILGYTPDDFYKNPYFLKQIAHPEEKEKFNNIFKMPVLFKEPIETQFITRLGDEIWAEIRSTLTYDKEGELVKMEGIIRDITGQKKSEEQIKHLGFHDKLTNLYNRAFFEVELKRLDTQRQLPLTIIIGDVNGLKLLNDTFGHKEGDRLLKIVSSIIKKSCRKEDIIARYGGDEFIIILPKTGKETAQKVIRKIKSNVMEVMDETIPISIALGLSVKEEVEQNIEDVVEQAEDNMYANKLMESKNIRYFLLEALEKKLKDKDYHDEGHVDRVKKITAKVGKYLKLSQGELEELSSLVSLHDIGKIAMPKDILHKRGKLSKCEKEVLNKHCEIGYRIANASAVSVNVADAVLYHHENWDGSGYPFGLKGEQIPYITRIFAVADVYDVMTNYRPYKETLTHREAIKEIEENAGTQFDPNVVKAFISVVDKINV